MLACFALAKTKTKAIISVGKRMILMQVEYLKWRIVVFVKTFKTILILTFSVSSISLGNGFMIESKAKSLSVLKARSFTFNESYPGGDTTTTPAPTTTTASCPTITCAPQTCPPQTCPPATCAPCEDHLILVYTLVPILTLVGIGAGSILGAVCMNRLGPGK